MQTKVSLWEFKSKLCQHEIKGQVFMPAPEFLSHPGLHKPVQIVNVLFLVKNEKFKAECQ